MKTDAFLSRLQKVKHCGKGRWMACCPAHDDHSPSLSIAEGDDGRVLVHCFGGECSVHDIVAAVGMSVSDLFPDRVDEKPGKRMRFLGTQVMESLALQAMIVSTASAAMARGEQLTAEDRKALLEASASIQDGVRYATH